MASRNWLIEAREEKHLTQQQTADIVGISRAHYTNIERGIRLPHAKTAKKIAEALHLDWTLFYEDEENVS